MVVEYAAPAGSEPRTVGPREKLSRFGVEALSNTELLAVILGTGVRGDPVAKVAVRLMRRYGMDGLRGLDTGEWRRNRGIGRAQACRMTACLELGRRLYDGAGREEVIINSPESAFRQVRDIARARKEHLVALYLNSQNVLLQREVVSIGSLNTTRTHPREILQPAVTCLAAGFVLAHNHPSGSLRVSSDDRDFTRRIREAAELLGFALYDHLVVAAGGYVSFKEAGWL
ncbi:MAG: DNA repair protein RadC [Acidobacteriota bacterium]